VRYTRIKKFEEADYQKAQEEYDRTGSCLDQTLYQLCKNHSCHCNPGWVYAKAFIIGRTYATGIERKVTRGTGQGSSMSKVARRIFEKREEVDCLLAKLAKFGEPLSSVTLKVIAEVHESFVDLLKEITRDQQAVRAFVSKYMHCHCPLVPIRDEMANDALRSLVRWKEELWTSAGLPDPPNRDDKYREFLARFFFLYEKWRPTISDLSVGRLDAYLIWAENRNQASKHNVLSNCA